MFKNLQNNSHSTSNGLLTRIAPTPSGYLHLGNVLSFAITASLARKFGAKILLRIDDLDKPRIREPYVVDIFETLHFLDFPWDLGPKNYKEYQQEYSQWLRIPLYQNALESLLQSPGVFACQCSRKNINQLSQSGDYPGTCKNKNIQLFQKDVNWRLETPENHPIQLRNIHGNSESYKIPASLKDFAIRRKNELPTYQLASLVDDLHFGVNLIVRGMDLLASSIAQMYLSQQLPENKFHQSIFYHHPLMMQEKGKKLSKSERATSIQHLRKTGNSKKDIFRVLGNFMEFKEETRSLDDFQNQLFGRGL